MRWQIILGILIVSLAMSACAVPDESAADGRLQVVATTGQIADAVQNIGGDVVNLTNLLGPGIDPHTYVATEGDLAVFQSADVIFYNGLHLEAQLERVLEQIGNNGDVTVRAVGEVIDPQALLGWEPEQGFPYDPHIWNDVLLWRQAVEVVRDTLIEADPGNSAVYSRNATAYLSELDALHTYIGAQVATIPSERRVLVTAHDAFGYFGQAYGFDVQAVQGISTEAEAGAADIQALANIIITQQVPAIFIESTISPRTIEAVQEAVRAGGHEVQLGGELFSDALGAPGSAAETYIGMMRHNIDTIVAALAATS
ncbi:MAG: zinc ABC transporter solute-binding protein [Oscillochloris sp.]|nr:zinc ABC transporter solute-binding protein [Oscillochloris sp.]